MEIYPLGHSSFRIKGKSLPAGRQGATLVTDPYDFAVVGLKFPKLEMVDIVTMSHQHGDHNAVSSIPGSPFTVDGPGEYEVKGVTIIGVASFHDDKNGADRGDNTIYTITIDGVRICHLGDLGHKLTDEQLTRIGDVDILLIPVGGHYTINSKLATQVVAQIEPLIVVPMHYKRTGLSEKLAKDLEPLENFLKEMGAEGIAPQPKLVMSNEKLPETTTVVVLE